jgi:hypothetical protein
VDHDVLLLIWLLAMTAGLGLDAHWIAWKDYHRGPLASPSNWLQLV